MSMPVAQARTTTDASGTSIDPDRLSEAAKLLKSMGSSEVFVFGSATRNGLRVDSDVDIAVKGLPPEQYFAAVSKTTDILGRPADIVDLDDPTPIVRYLLGSRELIRVG